MSVELRIEDEIESLFLVKDYRWKIDGALRYPNSDEIRQTIDRAKSDLYDEAEGTQLEVGRLIIKKRAGHFDVFVMIGEE